MVRRGLAVIAIVLAWAVSRWYAWTHIPFPSEDAFITYRVAWNLATHGEAAYNVGERVWSATSTPWMLLAALLGRFGADIPTAMRSVGTALDLGALLIGLWALRSRPWWAAVLAAFWVANPRVASLGPLGMETSAVVFCGMGALVFRTGWWTGALALLRPDAALAAGLFVLSMPHRQKVIVACLAALWVLPMLYYGQVVPNTVSAKDATFGTHWFAGTYHIDWLTHIVRTGGPASLDLRASVAWSFVITVGVALAAWRRSWWPVAFVLLVPTLYFVKGAPYFEWYAQSWFVMASFVAVLGLSSLDRRLVMAAAASALLSLANVETHNRIVSDSGRIFGDAGAWLVEHSRPGQTVFMEPLGFLGWYGRGLVIHDHVGLVEPSLAPVRREQRAGWFGDYVERERPDFLLLRASEMRSLIPQVGAGALFNSDAQFKRVADMYAISSSARSTMRQPIVWLQRKP